VVADGDVGSFRGATSATVTGAVAFNFGFRWNDYVIVFLGGVGDSQHHRSFAVETSFIFQLQFQRQLFIGGGV
jgi:hypothetical protein